MRQSLAVFGVAGILTAGFAGSQTPRPAGGVALADLSWVDAEPTLTASSVVVIPLGAGALEQGPHLKLNSDERLARYLASRVQAAASVVVAPVMTSGFHPPYVEYPGTVSLTQVTARTLTVDVVRALAKHGPRRFYVLNTERDALVPLSEAAKTLGDAGILLGYTDPGYRLQRPPVQLKQPPLLVAHADEVATSMMLFVDPAAVDMTRAVREYATGIGVLTRKEGGPGVFSRSGVLGDPTGATKEKGQVLVETLLAGALEDIDNLRSAALPPVKTTPPPPPPPPVRTGSVQTSTMANGCTPGQERDIRLLGPRFSSLWREMDAITISLMFTKDGDVRHPDGTIERGREIILQDRVELFKKKEYRGSIHPVQLNDIRCLSPSIAIADGKWELRLADPPTAKPYAGLCTLVLRDAGGWQIEAWRYTVDPAETTIPQPMVFTKPGWPGRGGG
jgi:creatinine amidohydrolase